MGLPQKRIISDPGKAKLLYHIFSGCGTVTSCIFIAVHLRSVYLDELAAYYRHRIIRHGTEISRLRSFLKFLLCFLYNQRIFKQVYTGGGSGTSSALGILMTLVTIPLIFLVKYLAKKVTAEVSY